MADIIMPWLNRIHEQWELVERTANEHLQSYSQLQLMLASSILTGLLCWLYYIMFTGYHCKSDFFD